MASGCLVLTLIVSICLVVVPVYSQINTPCSPSMITSFTPCLNFITNSTTNATSTPTSDCCNSLRSMTSTGTDCLCLIVTGSVPFQIPVNRSLAISLPRACQMPGVPLQCKAAAATPIPSPGAGSFGPAPSPGSSATIPEALSPESNTTPGGLTPPLAPESGTAPDLTPPSAGGVDGEVPTSNTGSRPTLTPSAAATSTSPFVVATLIAFLLLLLLIIV